MEQKLTSIENTKLLIERRYSRLGTAYRRPSCEYVTPEDIKEIFMSYASNIEEFSDMDLLELYDKWFEDNFSGKKIYEMNLPEIEDGVKLYLGEFNQKTYT
jgi:hypothetical protein